MSPFQAPTPEQAAHSEAQLAAGMAFAAVMRPADERYEAAIAAAKEKRENVPASELEAWRDAGQEAQSEYDRVMTERGFGGET